MTIYVLIQTRINQGGGGYRTSSTDNISSTETISNTETISSTSSAEVYRKVDCKLTPNHSWCLNSYGKECETYDEVTEKPVKSNHEKQLLLGLHNDDRAKVFIFSDFFIKVAIYFIFVKPYFVTDCKRQLWLWKSQQYAEDFME